MLVYRVCSQNEVNYILNNGNFFGVGGFAKHFSSNTHKYGRGYYMHFFHNKSDFCFVDSQAGNCICTYDIPDDLLDRGIGVYLDRRNFKDKIELIEYAVRSSNMDYSYLRKAEVLLDSVTLDDFIDGNLRDGVTKTIFESDSPVLR